MPFHLNQTQEDFLAQLTDAAYHVLLRQGLNRSFVEVELELWREIRKAAETQTSSAGH